MHEHPEIRKAPDTPEMPFITPLFPEMYPDENDEPEIDQEGDATTVSVPTTPKPELNEDFVPDLDDKKKHSDEEEKKQAAKKKRRQRTPTVH